jgi:hypothetical protein
MKHIVGKWVTIAKRLLVANLLMGAVFATIYYYINLAVTRGLIRRSLESDRTNGGVSVGVAELVKNDPRGSRLLQQVEEKKRTFSEQLLTPIMEADPWLRLENHPTHNWLWWFLKSMLLQSGMGADMDQVSDKHRMFQIVQIIEVLLMNAYVISL